MYKLHPIVIDRDNTHNLTKEQTSQVTPKVQLVRRKTFKHRSQAQIEDLLMTHFVNIHRTDEQVLHIKPSVTLVFVRSGEE